jgi:hypothetical protein
MIKHPFLPIIFDESTFTFWSTKDKGGRWWSDTQKVTKKYDYFYDKDGYAFFSCGKRIMAHRAAWECYNQKEIPKGFLIRHFNDKKEDLSKSNLVLGTVKDNSKDTARNRGWAHCKEGLKKATLKITKTWNIIHPNGLEEKVFGLEEFCNKHNLDPSTMIKTSNGVICEHKGFRCYKEGDSPSFKFRKTFILLKDGQELLKTNCPVKTCRELGLHYDNIRKMSARGKSYKGYQLRKEVANGN